MKEDKILNKKCKLVLSNSFILNGIVRDMNTFGIIFETTQKTSFIAWQNIREITPEV